MESTGIYQMPVKRFFKENNYNLYVINPIYSKMYKQNLRKTKTDKEDCLKLAELFFIKDFAMFYILGAMWYNIYVENEFGKEYLWLASQSKFILDKWNCG